MNSIKLGRRRGFTLIEMLAVIGIVAVIAATLLPVFAGVRERGRRTQCLSNERQLGIAVLEYVGDNNEAFPIGNGSGVNTETTGWAAQCYPYVQATQVYKCPDDETVADGSPGASVDSYGYNMNLTEFQTSRPHSVYLAQLSTATKTVLLFEVRKCVISLPPTPSAVGLSSAQGMGEGPCGQEPNQPVLCDTVPEGGPDGLYAEYATGDMGGKVLNNGAGSRPQHRGGANFVACDGHSIWLRSENVSCGGATGDPKREQSYGAAAGTDNPKYRMTFATQ